jgi:hypothetical protein
MANWQPLGEAYRAAQGSIVPFPDAGPNDVILVVRGCRFASGAWDAAGEAHQPMVTWCLLGDLKKTYAVEWLCKTPAAIPANLLASNLSARLRRYHEALVVVTKGGSEGMFVDELDAVPAARSAKKRKAKSTRKRRA